MGTKYVNGAITVTEEDARRDLKQGRSRKMVTFEVLRGGTNNIYKFLQFTGKPSEGEKGISCLETQV